jgi:hypothetical protein
MKKQFFFFAMCASVAASAQVTNVTPISANYADKTVSFRVWWNADSRDATHLSKVWVWVDYITVNSNNTTSGNTWTRALISGTPAATSGTPSRETGNDKGFWLQGNSGSYSATVTVELNITASKFNWCAYASDLPPNVTANNGTYTFNGTPPFTLIAANGTTTQTVSGKTLTTSALTITPTIIRDKTECPGVFCAYTGSDLLIDATHLCQLRTSGAQNWEAYIKDSRDDQTYRITQFSDGTWWFAVGLNIAATRVGVCGEVGYYYGNNKPTCPTGWKLPSLADMNTRFTSSNDPYGGGWSNTIYYGLSGRRCGNAGCNNGGIYYAVLSDSNPNTAVGWGTSWTWGDCGQTACINAGATCDVRQAGQVRCLR